MARLRARNQGLELAAEESGKLNHAPLDVVKSEMTMTNPTGVLTITRPGQLDVIGNREKEGMIQPAVSEAPITSSVS